MTTRLVHQDDRGLYVNINGSKKRPGDVVGYSHMGRMDAAGLQAGDYVTVGNVNFTPLARILCYENSKPIVLYWHSGN